MVETSHEDEFATKRIFNLEMVYFAAFSVVKETAVAETFSFVPLPNTTLLSTYIP